MTSGGKKPQKGTEVSPDHGVGKVGAPVGPGPGEDASPAGDAAAALCSFAVCQEMAIFIFPLPPPGKGAAGLLLKHAGNKAIKLNSLADKSCAGKHLLNIFK